ncbi:hypothetical protein COT72_02470 [archaeon CG10_big_fil_rev_8_21_14_0_10_43_11]|nr:MAG: hypothetical protein COT72_02470 [archaeon CG10_big_fil_rev_8_21_14_0_10_43_11]
MLAIKDELKARDVKQSDIVLKKIDVSKLTKNAKQSFIKNSPVFGTRLFGFANVLGLEIQKGKRLGTEFSYYAKQYGSVSGIIHSDEDFEKYGLNKKEIAKKLRVKESDAFVLVAAKEEQARKALDAVIERAKQCIPGVPLEVRAAQSDGTTVFLRPIPGKARMYPETDLEPITISKDVLANVKKHLPKKPHELQADLEKMGLSKDLALQMVHSRDFILFEQLAKKFTDAKMIATLVLAGKGAVERSAYDALLKAYEKQVLSKEALTDAVPKLLEGEKISDILAGAKKVGIKIVEARIKTIAAKNKGKSFAAVMGDVMKEFRGKVDGKTLSELVKKHVNIKN